MLMIFAVCAPLSPSQDCLFLHFRTATGLSMTKIIGFGAGGLVAVIIIVVIVWFVKKKKNAPAGK